MAFVRSGHCNREPRPAARTTAVVSLFTAVFYTLCSSLAIFVKGNINISGKIGDKSDDPFTNEPHLQGIYFANGQIDTNSDGDQSGNRLVVGGIFYARGGINLKRDLKSDNLTTPAELFIFRPDLVLNSSKETWSGKMSWMEVTP